MKEAQNKCETEIILDDRNQGDVKEAQNKCETEKSWTIGTREM